MLFLALSRVSPGEVVMILLASRPKLFVKRPFTALELNGLNRQKLQMTNSFQKATAKKTDDQQECKIFFSK